MYQDTSKSLANVATNKAKLMVYLDPEIKEKLGRLAEIHNRTMSNYVETLVQEAIIKAEQEGSLK